MSHRQHHDRTRDARRDRRRRGRRGVVTAALHEPHTAIDSSEYATVSAMMQARDLLVLARATAGISQAELASRLGRPRSTIARWELGEMQPAYDAVSDAIAACGLQASVELSEPDESYLYDVGEQLRLKPIDRLARLGSAAHVRAVQALADDGSGTIVIGDAAGALQGWPLTLPADADAELEVCAPAAIAPAVDDVSVVERPPGTRGTIDLRRRSERLAIGDGFVDVASPLDLLRIERARGRLLQAGALEAVLEHRRRWPDGPPARRSYSDDEARAAISAWQTSR